MNIWIFQTGEPLHLDAGNPRPMRAINLANSLVDRGHSVTIWSSSFHHQEKKHRGFINERISINEHLEIRLIHSPGYRKNISFSRLYDHFILAVNLNKELKCHVGIPDIAFIGYPPIECAFVFAMWLRKKNIPYILDVKDQWPTILTQRFPKYIRFLGRLALFPYYWMSKKTMLYSAGISAMSSGFVDWSLEFSNRSKSDFDFIAPLTSPMVSLTSFEEDLAMSWWSEKGVYSNNCFRIMFVGSFSRAFDFNTIFNAASILSAKDICCEFILCGDGELSFYLRNRAKKYNNVKVIEWVDQAKIITLSSISSAFIAPYINSSDFIISIPNKVIDALKLGLPLLSSLRGEVGVMIERDKVGFSYCDSNSLSNCIESLVKDDELQKNLSINALSVFKSRFEFNTVYNSLVDHLESIAIKD